MPYKNPEDKKKNNRKNYLRLKEAGYWQDQYEKHKSRKLKYARLAYEENPELFMERARAYAKSNPEKVREYKRNWYHRNKGLDNKSK